MSFLDVLLHALGSLRRQKLRTSLTVLGVALGVATIIIMVSFGAGVRKLVAEKFDRAELLTQIQVQPVKIAIRSLEDIRKLSLQRRAPERLPLNDEVIAKIREIPNVRAVYPDVTAPLTGECRERVETVRTEGLPLAALSTNYTGALLAGSYWEDEEAHDVCVLPSALLPSYGFATPKEALGAKIVLTAWHEIRNYKFDPPEDAPERVGPDRKPLPRRAIRPKDVKTREVYVLGVYDSEQFGITGGQLHVPLAFGKDLLGFSGARAFGFFPVKAGEYRQLVVKVEDRRHAAPARERIEALGYGTVMTIDVLMWINIFFSVVEAGLALFGGIGLFVASFGIANTMLMAVFERTREIGILKALGGRDRDVRRMFVVEAGSIGVAGGLLGIGAGAASGEVLNRIATALVRDEVGSKTLALFYVPPWLALGALAFATFVAVCSGLYPAWRAARLDPVESLRHE